MAKVLNDTFGLETATSRPFTHTLQTNVCRTRLTKICVVPVRQP